MKTLPFFGMPGSKIKHFLKIMGHMVTLNKVKYIYIYKKENKKIPAVTYTSLDPVW